MKEKRSKETLTHNKFGQITNCERKRTDREKDKRKQKQHIFNGRK